MSAPSLKKKTLFTPLLLGVKRLRKRVNAQQNQQAERAFEPLRKRALSKGKGQCIHCGYTEKINEVHTINLDPYDFSEDNLGVICALCHPYHHVGEAPRKKQLTGLDAGHIQNLAKLIHIQPSLGLTTQDMNHLQRALALALTDENEKEVAKKVYAVLSNDTLSNQMQDLFRTDKPSDFGQALQALTDDEFSERGKHIEGLRMVFAPRYLAHIGRQLRNKTTTPFGDPSTWETLVEKVLTEVGLLPVEPEPIEGVGLNELDNESDEEKTNPSSPAGAVSEDDDDDPFAKSL